MWTGRQKINVTNDITKGKEAEGSKAHWKTVWVFVSRRSENKHDEEISTDPEGPWFSAKEIWLSCRQCRTIDYAVQGEQNQSED